MSVQTTATAIVVAAGAGLLAGRVRTEERRAMTTQTGRRRRGDGMSFIGGVAL